MRTPFLLARSAAFAALMLLVSFFGTACGSMTGTEGEGIPVKEKRDVSGFTGIELGGQGEIIIKQGATFSVEIEAQPNILALVSSEVKGSLLVLDFKKSVAGNVKVRYYITMPSLDKLNLGGSGLIKVADVFSPKSLELDLGGSGSIEGNFIAGSIDAEVDGSGTIRLKGAAEELEAEVSGSGQIEAAGLAAKSVKASISGSGTTSVQATEAIDAEIAGSGVINYSGNPAKVKTEVTGSGVINKK